MGKNKLKKFAEMEALDNVFQYPFGELQAAGGVCPLRGAWRERVFGNNNPIVLELGCGKGEYTVGLARRFPERNFIGIDIKGARMWTGAKQADAEGLKNVAFLRTSIELLGSFFAPGEVETIWITFPDPQMKKVNKRLTGTRFLELYRTVMGPDGGRICLKTDSPFLYRYTSEMLRANGIMPETDIADVHGGSEDVPPYLTDIKTYYERQWMGRGLSIKCLTWTISPNQPPYTEPDVEIEPDTYRSFHRDRATEVAADQ